MTAEQVREFLNTPEGEQIKNELTEGLKTNRDKILTEKKTTQAELEGLSAKLQEYEQQVNDLQRSNFELKADSQINKALESHRVRSELKPILKKMVLANEGTQIANDGNLTVGNSPVDTYLAEFLNSENGKHYLSAPMSNGGGSTGNGITTARNTDYSGMSTDEIIRNATQN